MWRTLKYSVWISGLALLTHCGGSTVDDSSAADAAAGSDGATAAADAGPDGTIVSSGGTTADGGPGGSTTSISCGSTSCAIPSQSCCVERTGGGGGGGGGSGATYVCVSGSGCPVVDAGAGNNGDPPVALQCSGAANCGPGTVCCVSQTSNTTLSSCQASCGKDSAQLCDPQAATSGCTAGVACSSNDIGDWGLPRTFATCGGVGN
jgi:hypothetical protein